VGRAVQEKEQQQKLQGAKATTLTELSTLPAAAATLTQQKQHKVDHMN
jgi:hypothetical protein